LESRGRLWRSLADQYLVTPAATAKFPRGHQLALTAVAVSPNRKFVFTGAKDGTIIMWNAMTMKKVKAILGLIKAAPAALAAKGHTREVLCLAASASYLVSGGNDHKLNVWSLAPPPSLASATPAAPAPPELNHIKQFASHRDAVTGAVFRRGTQHLYTSSRDRTIKTWDLDEMTYVETLFGHQDPIPALDAAPSGKEMCFTAGGRDKSMRAWKIVDESQLVFRASSSHGSLDVVYAVTDDLFVSGDDHGNLSLWHTGKKKAIHSVAGAHGYMPRTESDLELGLPRRPYWVTAIAGIKFSDLLFSGSWSGDIICWRVDRVANKLHRASAIPVPGCINSLTVAEPADYPPALIASGKNDAATAPSTSPEHSLVLYAATGQEHKNGRWWKVPEARNVLYKVELSPLVNVSSSR
ncbi:WD40-repeat-containing domain protein, partial [Blastocladiella britannica]